MEIFKFTDKPVFTTLSWAITHYWGSQNDDKFYRNCECSWLYDLCCDEDGNIPNEKPEWTIAEKVAMDGVAYGRFEINEVSYWSALELQ